MFNKKILFMSVQPDVPYFHWQVEVQITNFIEKGIDPSLITVLWAIDSQPSYALLALSQKYKSIKFFWYCKTVQNNYGYIPILRPDILEQHFLQFPELESETIFYHDSDIIFRELPDFDQMQEDLYWYVSDTVSYIGANYIKSKSIDLFNEMCSLVGISPEAVESNEANSGGAQYVMKGLTSTFWNSVKRDSLSLYQYMALREARERLAMEEEGRPVEGYNPIQKWCADMWAVLWCAWKNGVQTKVTKELDFSWGTSTLTDYYNSKIMHNAGVTESLKDSLFYKGEFINRSPFGYDFSYVKRDSASYKYVEAIQKVI